ncbi:MAG: hypothetical protein LQ349_008016 [Xanthoria aureola]|nr:MAG: hypothetical protein LQ349_008016 [Xanthoria aureola]
MSEEDLTDAIKTIRTVLTARMLATPVGTLQRETGEPDALDLIIGAVKGLGNGNEQYTIPTIENVRAQWTGHRVGVTKHEPEPNISESEKFLHLKEETKSPITILYMHGGNNYLLGPAARRATTSKLAQLTGGKCLSIQYRLAPQNPFPAALLDCLITYLTLLYPSSDFPNASVPARHIVFAGDSGGAGLALSLVQVILYARKQQGIETPVLEFHGQKVMLPMPAGLAFQSPSVDPQLTTLPSWAANFEYDTVPPDPPGYDAEFPMDEVWPSKPPRGHYYCETSMLYHPLVCAMAADEWRGCPPIYMAIGSKERIVDAAKYFAQHVVIQGVPVLWEEFELMPHNWPMAFPSHRLSEKCYRSWANACSSFADGFNIQTRGSFTALKNFQERKLEVTGLTKISKDEVGRLMTHRESSIRPFTGRQVAKYHL